MNKESDTDSELIKIHSILACLINREDFIVLGCSDSFTPYRKKLNKKELRRLGHKIHSRSTS
jgi:hypothetical protein